VLIPGVTDGAADLTALGAFVGSLDNVAKFELLPYHRMGVYKWERLGKPYPLAGVPTPEEKDMRRAWTLVEEGMNSRRC